MPSKVAFKSAVHLFLIADGRVLLSRRCNTGYEDGNYSVPAGHLDGGEEVKAAAIREAAEEIDISLAPEDLEVVGVMHRKSDDERIDFFLTARRWSGEITNREPKKCDDLAWFALDQLPSNIVPYVARALDNVREGRWFDSFGWPPVANSQQPTAQRVENVEALRKWAALRPLLVVGTDVKTSESFETGSGNQQKGAAESTADGDRAGLPLPLPSE